jgi:hypothetical protein
MWYKVTRNTEKEIHESSTKNPEMLRKFFDSNHIEKWTRVGNNQDWVKFLSTGRNTADQKNVNKSEMPYKDHARAYKTKSGDVCYISQPYQNVETVYSELKEWAEERNLEVDIYDASRSWYNTDSTIVIVLHLPGVSFIIP